jgi:hypothetical protein
MNQKNTTYLKIASIVLAAFYFLYCIKNPDSFHFIDAVNLIMHEAGHFIFMFLGEFMHVLGGSLMQVLVPVIFAGYFFLRRDLFSGGIILMWVGESIANVAHYAADAVVQLLPLLGGDSSIHDWNWLLSKMHVLQYTSGISTTIYSIGVLTLVVGLAISWAAIVHKKTG